MINFVTIQSRTLNTARYYIVQWEILVQTLLHAVVPLSEKLTWEWNCLICAFVNRCMCPNWDCPAPGHPGAYPTSAHDEQTGSMYSGKTAGSGRTVPATQQNYSEGQQHCGDLLWRKWTHGWSDSKYFDKLCDQKVGKFLERCNRTDQLPIFFSSTVHSGLGKNASLPIKSRLRLGIFINCGHVTYNIFSVFVNCPSFWPRLTCHFPLLCCLCPYMGDGSHIGSSQCSHFKISFVYISVVL